MKHWRAILAAVLSAVLPAASAAPAWALERSVSPLATSLPPISARAAALPSLPGLAPLVPVEGLGAPREFELPGTPPPEAAARRSARPQADVGPNDAPVARIPAAPKAVSGKANAAAARREAARREPEAAPLTERTLNAPAFATQPHSPSPARDLDALFDGRDAGGRRASAAVKVAAFGALAPALLLAPHLGAAAAAATSVSYWSANILQLAFPMPEIYKAARRGQCRGYPLKDAVIGAIGTVALGAINGPLLHQTFWGFMLVFTAVGMVAPYYVARALHGRAAPEASASASLSSPLARLWSRVMTDRALRRSAVAGLAVTAASAALYAAAAAVVPHALSWLFSTPVSRVAADLWSGRLMVALEVLKTVLSVYMFVPVKHKGQSEPQSFGAVFELLFFVSCLGFVVWGLLCAWGDAGPIRTQDLVLVARNAVQALAGSWALRRSARLKHRR